MIDQLIESLWWLFLFAFIISFFVQDSKKTIHEETKTAVFFLGLAGFSIPALGLCYIIRPWL